MSEFVVWFDSAETGAPVLNNAAGSLIGVLDACLVTGFNSKSVTSITVASGVATATCNGHGFSGTHGKDVLISDATPAALNGRKALTFVDTNTFRFATTAPDGAATGTITAKRDPLGWVKQFSGTSKAIYKRSDVTATSMMLRVLDTAVAPATTTDARVFMVETATDVDTFTGQGPTEANLAGGQFWNKGANTATAKQWSLVGDAKGFYLWTQSSTTILPTVTDIVGFQLFGDYPSLKVGDAYNCMVSGYATSQAGTIASASISLASGNSGIAGDQSFVTARSYTQTGVAVPIVPLRQFASGSTGGASLPTSPSVIDSGFVLTPGAPLLEGGSPKAVRGYFPGFYEFLNVKPSVHYTVLTDVIGIGGRKVLAMSTSPSPGGSNYGQLGMDISGPWR